MREVKAYSNGYDGPYYDVYEGNINDIRKMPLKMFEAIPVEEEALITGGEYVVENGTIVEYLGDNMYRPLEQSPLRALNKYGELTNRQLKLFWTLVKNEWALVHYGI